MRFFGAIVILGCAASGCGSSAKPSTSSADVSSCSPGATLTGTPYDLSKSRFAFGSTPVRDDSNGLNRWVGVDGVLGFEPSGGILGIMNAGAPETSLPDWSSDPDALSKHVTEYFVTMGVASCQILHNDVLGGTGGRVIELNRGVDGIGVAGSLAYAQMNSNDQSTAEGFYWPEVSAEVVVAARAFRDRLATPAGLAAYKAKLPADAQGDGLVVIRHNGSISSAPFHAAPSYDVFPTMPEGGLGGQTNLSFDPDGNAMPNYW